MMSHPQVHSVRLSRADWRPGAYAAKVWDWDDISAGLEAAPPLKKLERGQIRVLELHPGERDDELRGSIRICTLDVAAATAMEISGKAEFIRRPYEALSYVWGSAKRDRVLKCNSMIHSIAEIDGESKIVDVFSVDYFDTFIPITESVETMLVHLRDTQEYRTLWIDGICINQDDLEERAEQVQQMRTIYSFASNVIVWLGPDDKNELTGAFTAARKLSSWYSDDDTWRLALQRQHDNPGPSGWGWGFRPWFNDVQDKLYLGIEEYKAFTKRLLDKPWFTRTWVYQEIALARSAVLACGSEEIDWETLDNATKAIEGLSMTTSQVNLGYDILRKMASTRQAVAALRDSFDEDTVWVQPKHAHDLQLETMLVEMRNRKVTDPRDKVYGLLGLLLSSRQRDAIKVDYGLSVREVYVQVARLLLETSLMNVDGAPGGALLPLSFVQDTNEDLKLPSWVADWSTEWRGPIICTLGSFRAASTDTSRVKCEFLAPTQDSHPADGADGHSSDSQYLLRVTGIKVLVIEERFALDNLDVQAEILGRMPDKTYPLTNTSYIGLYRKIVEAKDPDDFRLGSLRASNKNFWAHSLGETPTMDASQPTSYTAEMLRDQLAAPAFFAHIAVESNRQSIPIRDSRWASGFVSTNGFMGVVPVTSQPGDQIALLFGGSVPFVIREAGDGKYRLIGECYVLGLMDGEGLEDLDEGRVEDIVFC